MSIVNHIVSIVIVDTLQDENGLREFIANAEPILSKNESKKMRNDNIRFVVSRRMIVS